MIEWVEIKNWRKKDVKLYENFLVLIKIECSKEPVVEQASFVSSGKIRVNGRCDFENDIEQYGIYTLEITHAAPLNLPKEKTLEEKFEEFRGDVNNGLLHTHNLQSYTSNLAQIAREHYEGEK